MKYTVTIMNDDELLDGHGIVHTWRAYLNKNNWLRRAGIGAMLMVQLCVPLWSSAVRLSATTRKM